MTEIDPADLEYQRSRAKLTLELEEYEIDGALRAEMLAEPEDGLATLERVRRASGIRKPAAFAHKLWKNRRRRQRPEPEPEPEPEPGPPTLSALEFHWSRPPSPLHRYVEDAMAAAITAYGGFEYLRARGDLTERQQFDPDTGGLVATSTA